MTDSKRKAKYIEVTFADGQVWRVPAEVVATHRANYYAAPSPRADGMTTFQEEFDFAMRDSHVLIDWALDNMDPEDFEGTETRVVIAKPMTFEDGWLHEDSEHRIIWDLPGVK